MVLILHYSGLEVFVMPSSSVWGFLILNGFLSVFSDYLWARSILITSPLLATIGLSLTIPVAMVWDFAFNGKAFAALYFVGSVLVVAGFVVVNLSYGYKEAAATNATADASQMEQHDDDVPVDNMA
jgi:solute carrier family 35 protein F5